MPTGRLERGIRVNAIQRQLTSRRAISVVAGLVLVASAPSLLTTAGAASAKTCRVTNTTTGTHYQAATGSVLQLAIDEASSGDTLRIRGRCVGVFEIGGKSLTLVGVATPRYPVPSLDADGANDHVVTVTSTGVVRFDDLAITGSDCTQCQGGGIFNSGFVTLVGSAQVISNTATVGGGIYNELSGTVVLRNTASVSGNTAELSGAGVLNLGTVRLKGSSSLTLNAAGTVGAGIAGTGAVTLNDSSSINGNVADVNGGGIFSGGSVTLNDQASVSANTAAGTGGGILTGNGGTVTLRGSSSVDGNEAGTDGGGVYNNGSAVTVNGTSVITGNTAGTQGGGVFNTGGGTVTLNDSGTISGNSAPSCADVYPC
jgi:hypothetical protein